MLAEERNLVAMQQTDYSGVTDDDFGSIRMSKSKEGKWSKTSSIVSSEGEGQDGLGLSKLDKGARQRQASVVEMPDLGMIEEEHTNSGSDHGYGAGGVKYEHPVSVSHKPWWSPVMGWIRDSVPYQSSSRIIPVVSEPVVSESSSGSRHGQGAGGSSWKKYKENPDAPTRPASSALDEWGMPTDTGKSRKAGSGRTTTEQKAEDEAAAAEAEAAEAEAAAGETYWAKRDVALGCFTPENCVRRGECADITSCSSCY